VSYSVPSLATPHPKTTITLAALAQYEAARLFIDRAVAAQPFFQVTLQNAAAISDICHRLDGIPLAIELAAARVRALSVEQIAARLSDRFRLLTRGARTALPRQQTLEALIAWSYDLLSEPERALLRRLAVFAGGWTLAAAEAVGGYGQVATPEVLDLLTHLVEKSLVELEPRRERYRFLETVRQYAHERLSEALEGDGSRARHLAYYLAIAEEAEVQLRGPEQGVWLSRLAIEQENLLAAHASCDRVEGGPELGLTMVWAVQDYWFNRGLLELGHRLTVEALNREGAMERTLGRWRALATAGDLCYWMGRYAEAEGYLQECLSIARESGDRTKVAGVLMLLGRVSHGQRDLATARGYLEESLALARQPGGERRLPSALNSLADLHRTEGELDAAVPLYEESLALRREQGDHSNIAVNLLSLAMISIARAPGDPARDMALEALAIAEEIDSKRIGQLVLDVSAGVWASSGRWERAARFYGAAEAQRERMGLHREPVDEASLAPLIAKTKQALTVEAFAAAEAAGRALGYEEALTEARKWLASAH
jgi:predicted ATPase